MVEQDIGQFAFRQHEIHHALEVVAELIELTEQFGGEYDGWGCEVQAASS